MGKVGSPNGDRLLEGRDKGLSCRLIAVRLYTMHRDEVSNETQRKKSKDERLGLVGYYLKAREESTIALKSGQPKRRTPNGQTSR